MEVRYVLLNGHYRKPINFGFDSLHAAREALGKLAKAANGHPAPSYKEILKGNDYGIFTEALARLNDDLNTAGALGEVFSNVKAASSDADWFGFHAVLAALGLILPEQEQVEAPDEIKELAEKRWLARENKDWAASDQLRDDLLEKGWVVKDGRDGYDLVPS